MDDGPSILPIICFAALLLLATFGYVFFIASSLAIARARSSRITDYAQEGKSGAHLAISLLQRSDSYLVCSQVGRFICVLSAGMIVTELFEQLPVITRALYSMRWSGPVPFWVDWVANFTLVALFVPLTLIAVQFAKATTLQFPESTLCLVAWPLKCFNLFFGPLVLFVHRSVGIVLKTFGLKSTHERDLSLSSDDISELVRRSSQEGVMQKTEQELIEGVVELSDTIVREVMTPRTEVVFVTLGVSLATFVQMVKREGVSRVLVCGTDLDDVKGMVITKDLLAILEQPDHAGASWESYIRPVQFVPNTKDVTGLLNEFREKRVHFAVVLDEHGAVDGIVTLEDLVEEIVGDISDEYDLPGKAGRPVVQFDGAIILDGSLSLVDLQRHHSIALPEGDYDTVAGFVLSQLGHVPIVGESFRHEEYEFKVRDVQSNRVVRVSIHKPNSNRNKQDLTSEQALAEKSLALAVDSD